MTTDNPHDPKTMIVAPTEARPWFVTPAIVLWLVCALVLGPLYITIPPSPDQSQFDYMAWLALQGQPYYAGSFDMNWPGAMLLHEAGLRLFGLQAWTWRLTDFVLLQAIVMGTAWFLHQAGWRLGACLFLLLYPPLYITAGYWMAGQRDIVAAGFLLIACAFAMPGRSEILRCLATGALIACAVLIRPTYLSFLAGVLALEALPLAIPQARTVSRPLRALFILTGFGVVIGLVAWGGVTQGSIDDWYLFSFVFTTSVYGGGSASSLSGNALSLVAGSWHWIALIGVPGLLAWLWRDRLGHAAILVMGMVAVVVLSYIVQSKGFRYHLGGLLPLLVVGVVVAVDALCTARARLASGLRRTGATACLVLSVLLIGAGTASKLQSLIPSAALLAAGQIGPLPSHGITEAERRDLVGLIASRTDATDRIALYGTDYEIAYRAQRLPAYRFFTPAADQITPDVAFYEAWMSEIDLGLRDHSPPLVLIDRTWLTSPSDDLRALDPSRPILARLLAFMGDDYEVLFEAGHLILFGRGA